jgi:hypothetical protein
MFYIFVGSNNGILTNVASTSLSHPETLNNRGH